MKLKLSFELDVGMSVATIKIVTTLIQWLGSL